MRPLETTLPYLFLGWPRLIIDGMPLVTDVSHLEVMTNSWSESSLKCGEENVGKHVEIKERM